MGSKFIGAALIGVLCMAAWSGCATTKSKKATTPDPEEQEVMYGPPADEEKPPQVPRGAPILEKYEKPTSNVEPSPPSESVASGEDGTIQKQTLEAIMAQGPGWALTHVRVSPSRSGDAFVGFEITSFSPQAAATISPPLQVGDVITHLNGVRLKQPDDYMEAFNLSRTVTELRVDYVREESVNFTTWKVVE